MILLPPFSTRLSRAIGRIPALAALIALLAGPVVGADSPARPATGTAGLIEGRVFNPGTGEYLEFVRVTVEGTQLEAFTDSSGEFRLVNVPAGAARVTAFRTGVAPQSHPVTVAAGSAVRQNFELSYLRPGAAAGAGAVKLEQFTVATSKEMDGAAIAINTKRFAANAVNVVAANEFGPVADGGVGEVLKSVPGINITRGGFGDAYQVSLNGVPPRNVPITVGGIAFADASSGVQRNTGLQQSSINNFSRIEIAYTPTPEISGAALAGAVNMVPLSAFERSKPAVSYNVTMMMRDNARDFRRTPGPLREPARKVQPGSDFSAIVPVNDRFGFTLSGSASALYTHGAFMQNTWAGTVQATNGTTLPDTPADRPYLTGYLYRDRPVLSKRLTFGGTVDYRLGRYDRVSFSFLYGYSDAQAFQRTANFTITNVAPGNFTPTATRGTGTVQLQNLSNKVGGRMITPALAYRHDGPVWKLEATAGVSRSGRYNQNTDIGTFSQANAQRGGVTIAFDDIFYLRPRGVTVTDTATGTPVDFTNLANFNLTTANNVDLRIVSLKRTAFVNGRREFFPAFPLAVKGGLDVREEILDNRSPSPTYTFVGANGTANNADDNAAVVRDDSFSQRTPPFGFPRTDWVSNQRLFSLYRSNPAYFTTSDATTHTGAVANSKWASEVVSAAYVRGDMQFFANRLKLVGGLRVEQTNGEGHGPLTDATRNFQRDAAGRFILGANGRPQPIETNALAAARRTSIDRGLHVEKEYLRFFPSLNTTYTLRENLIVRGGYFQSIGRPNFDQLAGGITLPDLSLPNAANNRITVNNPRVKAWSAQTFKASLEYYFQQVGLISVSGYSRRIEDFFGSAVFRPTNEFLEFYGLDPSLYTGYDASTQFNLATPVRMSGVDVNYKQALTFLPNWARGVQVFANASAQRMTGDEAGNFAGYIPRTYNWGVSLDRPRYNLRMNWNYSGRARAGIVATGRGIDPATFMWNSKRMIVDLSAEYRFDRRMSAFMNLSNITDAPIDLEIAGPRTPDHAQFRTRSEYGAQWTFGVRGTF
jgi:TonB-dependent receptor